VLAWWARRGPTSRNNIIGCALSEVVQLEPLPDRISIVVKYLNHC
jgi:hypothetical protein